MAQRSDRISTAPAHSAPAPLVLPGRFRAAVFDMDGLVLDSERAWAAAETELLARRGHEFTEADRLATIGRSMDESVAIYGERIGLDEAGRPELRAELAELVRVAYGSIRPRPGAVGLVTALRGRMTLALASNTDRTLVDAALFGVALADAFDVIVSADDVTHPKPAPDLFALACRRVGVDPVDAIAFEDSGIGLRAARSAGLFVVAVPQFEGIDLTIADVVLGSLEDVVIEPDGVSR